MIFFISPEIAYILIGLIFSTAVFLAYKSLYKAFLGMLLLVPLMHKELFSLVIWDLLPVRIFLIGIGTVLVFKFLYFIKKEGIEKVYQYVLNDPFLIILSALWMFRLISIYNSTEVQRSFFLLAFFTLTFIIYLTYKHIIKESPSRFIEIVKAYLLVGFLTEVFALIQYYLRICCREKIGAVWVIPGFTPRLGSSFWDVNHYGAFLITLIPLIFNFFLISKKIWHKVMYFLFLILSLWLLFMTQSRSAWVGLLIGSAFTLVIYFWTSLKKALIITMALSFAALVGFIAVINILSIDVQSRVAEYMHHRLDSTDSHFTLLAASAEIFEENFFFGSGYGTFDSAFRETETATDYFDREPKLKESLVPSHSIWGEILGEGGAVGITLYSILMTMIVGYLIYAFKQIKNAENRYLGIGLFGGLISILTAGLFYSYNMEFYWIYLFMCIGYILISMNFDLNISKILSWWSNLNISPYIIIVPISVFFIFINLGGTSLIDYDEAIYAKVAKNIILTGDWITLRWDDLNSYWFEKPPFYMWITALLFKLTGFGEFAARFTSAFFGVMGVIFVYLFGKNLYNKTTGLIAALILTSTVHYMYYARNGMLDVTVTFFILSSIFFFYYAWQSNKNSWRWYLVSGIMIGFGIMTKSIIGLLPLVIIGVYILAHKLLINRKTRIPYTGSMLALLGLLIIAAPWHIYAYMLHGHEFIDEYILEHVFKRGLTGLGHKAPLLWYLEVIKVSFRIWVIALIPGLITLPFLDKSKRSSFLLLSLAIATIFTFFSSSEDKLQWYIIPIYPYLAIIAARFIERFFIIGNDLIRKDYALKPVVLRSILITGTIIVSIFYFLWNKDKVYYPDFNKDKVALIRIFNEKYSTEEFSDRKLYYYNMSYPILLFYSDHPVKSIDSKDSIIGRIEDLEPDKTLSFLTSAGAFYNIRDQFANPEEQDKNLGVSIDGATGDWILFRSLSRVEILQDKFTKLKFARNDLYQKQALANLPLTLQEKNELIKIEENIAQIVAKLTEYGYTPEEYIK